MYVLFICISILFWKFGYDRGKSDGIAETNHRVEKMIGEWNQQRKPNEPALTVTYKVPK